MKELINVQQNLIATKSHSDQRGNFSYRTAEDILAAFKLLPEAKTCTLITDTDIVVKGDNDRQKQFVECVATFTNEEGKSVSARGYAEIPDKLAAMSLPQITGSCESYAKKRALGNLFLIEDSTSDPDSKANIDADVKVIKANLQQCTHMVDLQNIASQYWNFIQNDKTLYSTYQKQYSTIARMHPEEVPQQTT